MVEQICGVTGSWLFGTFEPCGSPATEAVRSVCDRSHVRERTVCPSHADALTRPRPDERAFCLVCFETTGDEVPLTSLVEAPDRPPAEQPWREAPWST